MPFQAKAVANHILDLAEQDGRKLDPMQLQKLVYFAHGWHLGLSGQPLIKETVEAWPYGPVVPVLFHEFKKWGNSDIREGAKELRGGVIPHRISLDDDPVPPKWKEYAESVVKRVWLLYGRFSGVSLSELTHEVGSPWYEARKQHPGERDVVIPNEAIRVYFKGRLVPNVAGRAATPA